MESDAHRVRGGRPVVLTNSLTGEGIERVVELLESYRKVPA